MAVILLYQIIKLSEGLLAKTGKRVVEGDRSARIRRWSRREASATVVWAAIDAVRELMRALFWVRSASWLRRRAESVLLGMDGSGGGGGVGGEQSAWPLG